MKSQQRAVLQQLMANPDPTVQATLRDPANLGFIKSLIGLNELVVPGEEARTKQLREMQQLLSAAPIALAASSFVLSPSSSGVILSEAKDLSDARHETDPQRDSSADANRRPQNDNAGMGIHDGVSGGANNAGQGAVHFISTSGFHFRNRQALRMLGRRCFTSW